MNESLWDVHYGNHPDSLEGWLYSERSLRGKSRDWLVSQARSWPVGTTLLDAGCGGGVIPFRLQEAGLLGQVRYSGIDGSVSMIALARKKVTHEAATFVVGNIQEFEAPPTFDRVLLSEVIAHQADPEPVLTAALRAVKPGGELIIIFWNNPSDGERIYQETSVGVPDVAHEESLLASIINKNGFVVVDGCVLEEVTARKEPTRVVWVAMETTPATE